MFASTHQVLTNDDVYTLRSFEINRPQHAPLFICYSLINRSQILDLTTNHSFIKSLNDKGHSVYLIDWHYQTQSKKIDLESYLTRKLAPAFKHALKHAQQKKMHLLGICQGGNLALMYNALYPKTIKGLSLINTPIDFHTPNDTLSALIRTMDPHAFIDAVGDLPGACLTQFFIFLRPLQFFAKSVSTQTSDPALKQAFDDWLLKPPDVSGLTLKEYIDMAYEKNSFMQKHFSLGKKKLSLDNIDTPLLNIVATQDHIVPKEASLALTKLYLPAQIETYCIAGGHIGILLNRQTRDEICTKICKWINKTD